MKTLVEVIKESPLGRLERTDYTRGDTETVQIHVHSCIVSTPELKEAAKIARNTGAYYYVFDEPTKGLTITIYRKREV